MKNKVYSEKEQIINSLTSDLSNLLSEFDTNQLTKEILVDYFCDFLLDAKVDSKIVVNVLEDKEFGEIGKNAALGIKINEGW